MGLHARCFSVFVPVSRAAAGACWCVFLCLTLDVGILSLLTPQYLESNSTLQFHSRQIPGRLNSKHKLHRQDRFARFGGSTAVGAYHVPPCAEGRAVGRRWCFHSLDVLWDGPARR